MHQSSQPQALAGNPPYLPELCQGTRENFVNASLQMEMRGVLRQAAAALAQPVGDAMHRLRALQQAGGGLVDLLDIAADLLGGGRLLLHRGRDLVSMSLTRCTAPAISPR